MLTFYLERQFFQSLCFFMIISYISQVFFYFIHRLNATCMLWIQVYEGVFMACIGYSEGLDFLTGNPWLSGLLPKALRNNAYAFAAL